MNTDSSALMNSLGSTRDFLATKQAKLPHPGDVPPMRKPAHHQLTTSTVQATPVNSMPSPVGSMPPPSQDTDAESPMTLQGLLDSWGRDGSNTTDASLRYDLNSDGVVNVLDLIKFLMQMPGGDSSSGPPPVRHEEKGNASSPLSSSPPGEVQLSPAPDPSPGVTVADTVDETDPTLAPNFMWAPNEEGETPLSLQGLLDSWGQTGSSPDASLPYDLNSDGVVNVLDLIKFLMQMPAGGSSSGPPPVRHEEKGNSSSPVASPPGEAQLSPAPDPSPGVTVADTVDETDPAFTPNFTWAPNEEGETPLNLQGLLDSWGQTGASPYDLNFDGVVNVLDLLQWLMEGPDSGDAPRTGTTESSAPAAPAPSLAARDQVKLGQMADTLVSNLSDAGFTQRPPSDIGEKIDALKLNGPQKRFVMGHIASNYPHGLGVSLVG